MDTFNSISTFILSILLIVLIILGMIEKFLGDREVDRWEIGGEGDKALIGVLSIENGEYVLIISGVGEMIDLGKEGVSSKYGIEWHNGIKAISRCIINNGCESIGEGMFNSCDKLKRLDIPLSVKHISKGAILKCSSLNYINYAGSKTDWENIECDYGWHIDTKLQAIVCSDNKRIWLNRVENKNIR